MEIIIGNNNKLFRFENKVVISIINLSMIKDYGIPREFSEDIIESLKYRMVTVCLVNSENKKIIEDVNIVRNLTF
jgi:hypothetical protein